MGTTITVQKLVSVLLHAVLHYARLECRRAGRIISCYKAVQLRPGSWILWAGALFSWTFCISVMCSHSDKERAGLCNGSKPTSNHQRIEFIYLPWRLPLLQSRAVHVAVLLAVFLSNGLLDPWSSGGVLYNLSKSTVAVIIPEGAHHLDLRASNPADPVSVRTARNVHRKFIRLWLRNHKLSEHILHGGM